MIFTTLSQDPFASHASHYSHYNRYTRFLFCCPKTDGLAEVCLWHWAGALVGDWWANVAALSCHGSVTEAQWIWSRTCSRRYLHKSSWLCYACGLQTYTQQDYAFPDFGSSCPPKILQKSMFLDLPPAQDSEITPPMDIFLNKEKLKVLVEEFPAWFFKVKSAYRGMFIQGSTMACCCW